MRKIRLCSLLLILSMVMATFTLFATPAMAEETAESNAPVTAPDVNMDFSDPSIEWWDGSVDTEFVGSGTEDDPYLISSAAELAGLAELTKTAGTAYHSAHYELTADIYINNPSDYMANWDADFEFKYGSTSKWTGDRTDFVTKYNNGKVNMINPIASAGSFTGVIKGNDHSIYGFATYANKQSKNVGLIAYAGQAKLSNINMVYAAIYQCTSSNGYATGTFVAAVSSAGTGLEIDNCHAIHCNVYNSAFVGGIVGNVNKTKVSITNTTFNGNVHLVNYTSTRCGAAGLAVPTNIDCEIFAKNCSVSGKVEGNREVGKYVTDTVGGFFATSDRKNCRVVAVNCVNYADVISTTSAGAGGIISNLFECGSSGSTEGVILVNCANYGDVTSYGGPAGGLAGSSIDAFNGSQPQSGVRAFNFMNYGTITGTTAGQVIGLYGVNNAASTNNLVELENAVLAGDAIAKATLEGAVATTAGTVFGTIQEGILTATKSGIVYNQIILNNVHYSGDDALYGTESTAFAIYKVEHENQLDIHQTKDVVTLLKALNTHVIDITNSLIEPHITNGIWTLDASTIQAASLQLSDGIGVNFYSEARLGFKDWLNNKVEVSLGGETKAILDNLGVVTMNDQNGVSKQYFHYRHNVNPAEIGESFTYTLNGSSVQYGVAKYAENKYDKTGEKTELNQLLDAILRYGKVASGGEYDADALQKAFDALTLSPTMDDAPDCFKSATLNLDGRINLMLKVGEGVGSVKVSYTNENGTHATVLKVKDGEVVFEGIVATALNFQYTLTACSDAEGLVPIEGGSMNWNVSRFIVRNEINNPLAQALALYMQAARIYTGLPVAE